MPLFHHPGAVSWAIAGGYFQEPALHAIWLIPTIVLVIQFSTQLQMQYFEFWRVEADDKLIAGLIQQASTGKPENSMTLGAQLDAPADA